MDNSTCSKPDCKNLKHAHGLCSTHYVQAKKSGEIVPRKLTRPQHRLSDISPDKTKATCSVCGPTELFTRETGGGYMVCMASYAMSRTQAKNSMTPMRNWTKNIWKCYRLTPESYHEILLSQGVACAICKTKEPGGHGNWHVDHDHSCCPGWKTCGKCIRGLLCHLCNLTLGGAKDDVVVLQAMIEYLSNNLYKSDPGVGTRSDG